MQGRPRTAVTSLHMKQWPLGSTAHRCKSTLAFNLSCNLRHVQHCRAPRATAPVVLDSHSSRKVETAKPVENRRLQRGSSYCQTTARCQSHQSASTSSAVPSEEPQLSRGRPESFLSVTLRSKYGMCQSFSCDARMRWSATGSKVPHCADSMRTSSTWQHLPCSQYSWTQSCPLWTQVWHALSLTAVSSAVSCSEHYSWSESMDIMQIVSPDASMHGSWPPCMGC